MAAADKKITYTAAEVAELIRPLSQSVEALQKENVELKQSYSFQLGDPVYPELAETTIQAYEAAASDSVCHSCG